MGKEKAEISPVQNDGLGMQCRCGEASLKELVETEAGESEARLDHGGKQPTIHDGEQGNISELGRDVFRDSRAS